MGKFRQCLTDEYVHFILCKVLEVNVSRVIIFSPVAYRPWLSFLYNSAVSQCNDTLFHIS